MPDNKGRKATIRGVDPTIYHAAKVAAAVAGIPVYKWVQDAMKEKLERGEQK